MIRASHSAVFDVHQERLDGARVCNLWASEQLIEHALEEMAALAPEVSGHDPRLALTDEGDGLACYRIIAGGAPQHLQPGGRLMVEIGPTQGQAVCEMFQSAGLVDNVVLPDLDGRDRVVSGRRPG